MVLRILRSYLLVSFYCCISGCNSSNSPSDDSNSTFDGGKELNTDENSDTEIDIDSNVNTETTELDSHSEICETETGPDACFTLDESAITVSVSQELMSVSLPLVTKNMAHSQQGTVEVWIKDLAGKTFGRGMMNFSSLGGEQTVEVQVDGVTEEIELGYSGNYVIHYELVCDSGTLRGARSLLLLAPPTQAVLSGSDVFMAGETAGIRLFVQDPHNNTPQQEVASTFHFAWRDEEGTSQSVEVFSGSTDAFGQLNAELELPEDIPNTVTLKAEIENGLNKEVIEVPVTVKRLQNILVTTDKPLYQPGQTMHIRSLALRRPDLLPEAGVEVTIEVMDSKGNKVFKKSDVNDSFGIASAQFRLAKEVLLGTYTVTVSIGDYQVEKSVSVDRYTLPKFNIAVETDKAYYTPGDVLSGTVDVQYFFGESVYGGAVEIVAEQYDTEFSPFTSVSGQTDENGLFSFELTLPNYFVGQPLDDGNAFVLLKTKVTDTAGHERVVETTRPVANAALLPQVIPESGNLVPGIENIFYLLTTDPRGIPVATTSDVSFEDSESMSVSTNEHGIGTFKAVPSFDIPMNMTVTSTNTDGLVGSRQFNFVPGENGAYVLLRTDRAVYKVGDLLSVSVICPDVQNAAGISQDRIYLDIIKDGRTVLMTTVDLTNGDGVYQTAISPELVGGFELDAYYLTTDGMIMRDRKVVYVDPSDGLNIDVMTDKSEYSPAEEAQVRFSVTRFDGSPVSAAIGLQVVDEAVFSLMEFKPGLERVFYAMEKEILEPRYETHGYDMNDIEERGFDRGFDNEEEDARQSVAEMLIASASGGTSGIFVDTYAKSIEKMKTNWESQIDDDSKDIVRILLRKCRDDSITTVNQAIVSAREDNYCMRDPWYNLYQLNGQRSSRLAITSAGPDEDFGTSDDISRDVSISCSAAKERSDDDDEGESDDDVEDEDEEDNDDDEYEDDSIEDHAENSPDTINSTGNNGGGERPRVRKDFPETLHVNPALITDSNGIVELTIPLADSITSWRLSAMASSTDGLLGSTLSGITVFQEFFVDIDFPSQLTQNDEVSVPIAVYNYLDEAQSVTLIAEEESWYELLDSSEKTIEIGPGQIIGESFTIRVREVGTHALTVYGIGNEVQDAVQCRVEVIPNGKEILETKSDHLSDTVDYIATIPEAAIDNASKIMVKIYPGILAQVVEGLDSLLRLPSGCFEQTSSSTYPNVLVLNYLMTTGEIAPEVELQAREFINLGYQQLLTFEVNGGGFEWFGEAPAHNILTAYGLLEFSDMAKVHSVDPAIITRTQQWLIAQQASDGHYEPTTGGIAEGAINAYEDDVARTTAYITYALSESGYTGIEVAKGIEWIKENYQSITDSYGLAMIANALVSYDPNDAVAADVLQILHEARVVDERGIYWTSSGQSTTFATGDVINIETTALVGYAMLQAGSYPEDVDGAMSYLISNKDAFGNWHTTQATILTLRLMLATIERGTTPGAATVRVFMNDILFETLDIDSASSDVLRLVDLGNVTIKGENTIRIEIDGDSSYLYQIISRYYIPWEADGGGPNQGPLLLDVGYDKTELYVDDIVTATVTISNTVPDSVVNMVLVDLGIPPGFELIDTELQRAIDEGILQKIEKTKRQLTLYLEKIIYNEPLTLNYELRAIYPVAASSGESETHPYYTPSQSTQIAPIDFLVGE